MSVYTIIITYVITINLIAFFLMGLDKWKARKRAWRIPEVTLFLFHHKTRHWYFLYGLPLILCVQLLLIYLIWHSPVEIGIL